jgi:hypothetical protein
MINISAINQTKAFARQDGALLALLWISAFAFTIFAPQSSLGGLLALSTPFIVVWRMISFRNYALEGQMSYRRALVYCMYTFFYSSLIFGVAQFIYFRFFDDGRFFGIVNSMAMTTQAVYKQNGIDTKEIKDAMTLINSMSPLELSFIIMMYNLIIGWLCSIFLAAFALLRIKK